MAEETCWSDFSDVDLHLADSPIASRWSISTLVKTVCSLSHIAEDNFETPGTKRFLETLAKNDLLCEQKCIYVCGQIGNIQKSHSTRRPAQRLILPPFPLKRRWSELALPTFVTSKKENKGQECDCSKALQKTEEIIHVDSLGETPEGPHVEAETEETENNITFSQTTMDVLEFLEDTNSKKNQGAQNAGDSLEKNISVEWDDIISQMMLDLTYVVNPSLYGNSKYDMAKDIISRDLPSTSPIEETQEEHVASSERNRRGLKRVRKHIRNMFGTLYFCFSKTCKNHTTSRIEDDAQASGS
ncbi:hypothetical protein HispidOSU_004296 [Sigmodon hispidus]